ncbi:F-box only protein 15 [Bagarius yarrelli]|uniref:F-box only protein 15 n=1 Tax=Bagarius yarrelli TaxID=175774 RepID=A0A556TWA5_BAGYA|nr:F-box only protein 15 [Bagarius yarrelli]
MPPEITEKIISYLDAGSLFCLGLVNKHFHELAENNAMWYRFYTWQRAKTKTSSLMKDVTDEVDMDRIPEKPKGYWKRVFFEELASRNKSWKKKLKSINSYTGLPIRTAEVLRSSGVTWEMTVRDAQAENRIKHTHVYLSQASLTVGWSSGNWPTLNEPATLELHGVMFVPINCPIACRPGWRSLLSKVVVKKNGGTMYGSDGIITLLDIGNGVTVGVWQKQQEIAFVLATLHYHRLVERTLLGSSTTSVSPYDVTDMRAPFDDIDPDYGLHSYSMHLELHNTQKSIVSVSFSQLFCRKDQIADGYVPLQVISKANRSRQTPLCRKISLPWRTEALRGHVENCCMLTLTVLTEAQTPFWCVSAPVAMANSNITDVSYACNGESYFMEYKDTDGKMVMELEWTEEQKQFIMVDLILFLSISKVNRYFGRNY